MRSHLLATLPLLLVLGCSGPEQGITPPQGPGNAPNGGDATDGGGGGGPGGPPAFGRVDPPGFVLSESEGVVLSGRLTYIDEAEPAGTLRLEVMAMLADGESTLLAVQDLEELGDWKMRVPKDLGAIGILAYFDAEMNGPSPGEPLGQVFEPVVVGQEDIAGIDLTLSAMEPVAPEAGAPGPEGEKGEELEEPPEAGAAAEPAPVEDAPAEPAPVEEAPAEPTPVEEAPAVPAPVEEAPAVPAPVEEAPAVPAPAEEAPTE